MFLPTKFRAVSEAFSQLRAWDFRFFPSTNGATFYATDGSPSTLDYFIVDQSVKILARDDVYHHHLQMQHVAISANLEFNFHEPSGIDTITRLNLALGFQ
jgi:hypothetical protein